MPQAKREWFEASRSKQPTRLIRRSIASGAPTLERYGTKDRPSRVSLHFYFIDSSPVSAAHCPRASSGRKHCGESSGFQPRVSSFLGGNVRIGTGDLVVAR